MENCNWEKIHSFRSHSQFHKLVSWLEDQKAREICIELSDDVDSLMPAQKRIFKSLVSNEIWELLLPDPGYFAGSWLPKKRDRNG